MSLRNKPVRQDYIAKIRYTNNLPPPPLNPKFIEYNTTTPVSPKTEGEQLLSSLFRKENFQNLMERIDDHLGLELNLINNNGFLDYGKPSSIGQLTRNDEPIPLHPKDRALLRDAGIGSINKSEPAVSFLRRTEYISERSLPKATSAITTHSEEIKVNEKLRNSESHDLDADAQLEAVEETFTAANNTLQDKFMIKHPRKKHLKAVDVWPLLPDTSMMDNIFMNLRFVGSASVDRELKTLKRKQGASFNEKFQKQKQESSIFRPINSEDGEWITMFELDDENQANQIYQKLHSTEPEKPINLLDVEDETGPDFNFKFVKNYDMQYQEYPSSDQELAIKFIPQLNENGEIAKKRKVAYYTPVSGKVELRKYRASTNSEINKFVKERTYDGVLFKLREPTTNELKEMDKVRSEYDPMEYEGEDEDDEEEVVEEKEQEQEQAQVQVQENENEKENEHQHEHDSEQENENEHEQDHDAETKIEQQPEQEDSKEETSNGPTEKEKDDYSDN
ncbi:hypothetical protein KGF56_002719 [Candida oxycetoniae]|uniref:RNA polymerase II-associated protein 1 n=1 Tax=Candida oxycetoniae TaxID=497107 RepID=A0AAI9SWQ8_9ASCO|nr:uncharacterized protein KGF56_002719 [Candida oxycetoniae]KAI3404527.2 hypothetical protein KGF56_002719 [Candida oxycetoniae]